VRLTRRAAPGWRPWWGPGAPWSGRFRDHLTPPRLFVLSFLALIAAGTVGLLVLPGLYVGPRLGWVDALFTATSAVCVTGLVVVDTATYFTFWGQLFVLTLIQLGGLGMITFTTVIILALGGRLRIRHEAIAASTAGVAPQVDFKQLARSILRFTFLFEAVAALGLWLLWGPRMGWGEALWHAVFQSVSAFCNAGFSTFSDSMEGFRQDPATLGLVMTLIVIGGIGFLTVEEVRLAAASRGRRPGFRLSLHSRLVLSTTAVLLAGGWILYTAFEWHGTLGDLPWWGRAVNGLFASVTARTAGFHTIEHAVAADATNFLTILLMSIGGSPGSTAGGMKTTTAAVIAILAWSRLRGRPVASAFQRTFPEETVQRAVGLFAVGFVVVTVAIFVLATTEIGLHGEGRGEFLPTMFEAVSAFNTVGLSMGLTPELGTPGRLITTLLMYVGRVGPLTFAAAIALRVRTSRREFHYAHEDVVVG
jgi:trk system potassium uptake protein